MLYFKMRMETRFTGKHNFPTDVDFQLTYIQYRVGDFSGRKKHYKEQPIVVQDEFGREIYR